MADKEVTPYPKRNYAPMFPMGHNPTSVSDGSGKGNVSPSRADEPKNKGQNPDNYDKLQKGK